MKNNTTFSDALFLFIKLSHLHTSVLFFISLTTPFDYAGNKENIITYFKNYLSPTYYFLQMCY